MQTHGETLQEQYHLLNTVADGLSRYKSRLNRSDAHQSVLTIIEVASNEAENYELFLDKYSDAIDSDCTNRLSVMVSIIPLKRAIVDMLYSRVQVEFEKLNTF